MDISIIVPVYGVEAYIEECLRSVMAQEDIDGLEIECLVVDDRGPDRSMEIARKVIESYDGPIEFRIITREANGGLSAARNSGIREARGKYVYFLDSDDLIATDAMRRLYEVAMRYPDAQIVTGKFVNFPGSKQIKFYQLRDHHGDSVYRGPKAVRKFFLSGFPVISCNKLIDRKYIISSELMFKEGIIHEDDNWMARAYHKTDCVAICDSVSYYYRLRENSITSKSEKFSLKSLNGYSATALELFSQRLEWDKPWMDWTLGVLDNVKFWHGDDKVRAEALRLYKQMLRMLLSNKSVSLFQKMLYRYHSLPRPLMRVGVVHKAAGMLMRE